MGTSLNTKATCNGPSRAPRTTDESNSREDERHCSDESTSRCNRCVARGRSAESSPRRYFEAANRVETPESLVGCLRENSNDATIADPAISQTFHFTLCMFLLVRSSCRRLRHRDARRTRLRQQQWREDSLRKYRERPVDCDDSRLP